MCWFSRFWGWFYKFGELFYIIKNRNALRHESPTYLLCYFIKSITVLIWILANVMHRGGEIQITRDTSMDCRNRCLKYRPMTWTQPPLQLTIFEEKSISITYKKRGVFFLKPYLTMFEKKVLSVTNKWFEFFNFWIPNICQGSKIQYKKFLPNFYKFFILFVNMFSMIPPLERKLNEI